MNFPFWLANGPLLFFAFFAFAFISITRKPVPEREEIKPLFSTPKKELRSLAVNIQQIYENDLFETYKKELPRIEQPDFSIPFPEPPRPQIISVPEIHEPKFLDPLNITLKGIIVVSTSDKKNRAIITNNETEQESTYKVGDVMEDAQLIRIFRNKVTFFRSNGQQEVLYLREQDAQLDPSYSSIEEWNTVVQETGENNYIISPQAFTHRIKNIAQFINMLELTTGYKNGTSIGIQVGSSDTKSLGVHLGLQRGDLVYSINDIPPTSIENRLAIYNNMAHLKSGDTITTKMTRNKQELTLHYKIQEFFSREDEITKNEETLSSINELKEKKNKKILKEKYEFAPTIEEIRKQERKNMLEKGKAPK